MYSYIYLYKYGMKDDNDQLTALTKNDPNCIQNARNMID